jgi:hypothetical protein
MKMFSLLAAAVLFSGAAVANAAEPVALTDTQLDSVTAGVSDARASVTATASGVLGAVTNITVLTETSSTATQSTAKSMASASSTSL